MFITTIAGWFASLPDYLLGVWQTVTWHSTAGAILVPLGALAVSLAVGLVLSRSTRRGDNR